MSGATDSRYHQQTQQQQQQQQQGQQQRPQGRTKHQTKVANGLKAELSRLQPNPADTVAAVGGVPEQGTGRKLRSQESTRLKSELSNYFPEYDEIIGNDPKEERKRCFCQSPIFDLNWC